MTSTEGFPRASYCRMRAISSVLIGRPLLRITSRGRVQGKFFSRRALNFGINSRRLACSCGVRSWLTKTSRAPYLAARFPFINTRFPFSVSLTFTSLGPARAFPVASPRFFGVMRSALRTSPASRPGTRPCTMDWSCSPSRYIMAPQAAHLRAFLEALLDRIERN